MDSPHKKQIVTPSQMESQITNNLQEQNNTVYDVAKVAVTLALGEENDYVQRLLVNKLEGREKKYKSTPITELLLKPDRTILKKNLIQAINITQKKVIDVLCKHSEESSISTDSDHVFIPQIDNAQPVIDMSNNQAVSSWIINTLLQEKINYRELQEKAEKWQNINGILALVLPLISAIITGLLEHYLSNGNNQSGSQ